MKTEMEEKTEQSRERERERSRRGDRPSRFSDNSRERSRDRHSFKRSSGGANDRRIYVSNIPYEYRWQELKDLFRNQVGEVSFVELFVDENDKPRGCGIVEFETHELVDKAMNAMHRFDIGGRKLVIKEDFGTERDKQGHVVRGSGRRSERDRMPDLRDEILSDPRMVVSGGSWGDSGQGRMPVITENYNTYGLSTAFLEGLGITGPLHTRVFVANLDYKVDAKKLKEVFRLAGRVQSVDLSVDKDGNSRGFAVIEYDHPVESVQAISMLDRQMLYDRKITVRMDRIADKSELRLPEGLTSVGIGLGPNGEPLKDVAHNLPQSQQNINNPPIQNQNPPQSQNNQITAAAAAAGLLGAGPFGGLNASALTSNLAALSNVVGGNAALAALAGNLGVGVGGLPASLLASLGNADFSALGLGNALNANTLASLSNAANLNSSAGIGVANSASALNSFGGGNALAAQQSQAFSSLGGGGGGNAGGGGGNSVSHSGYNTSSNAGGGGGGYQTRDFDQMSSSSGTVRNFNSGGGGGGNQSSRGGGDSDYNSRGGAGGSLVYGSLVGNGNNSSARDNQVSGNAGGGGGGMQGSITGLAGPPGMASSGGQGGNTTPRSLLSDTIVVNHLPPTCTWQALRDKFRDVGDIKYAEMRGKDIGVIRFSNEWDAQRAIKVMDGARIDGRSISVGFL